MPNSPSDPGPGIPPSMTISQNRGRFLFAAALILIAAFILKGLLASLTEGRTDFSGMVGMGLLLLMLVLAFRGGPLALKLTKGCAAIFCGAVTLLTLLVSLSLICGVPWPQTLTVGDTVPFVAMVMGSIFSVWALFRSADVKAYIQFLRDRTHHRQLQKIYNSHSRSMEKIREGNL